MNGSSSIETNAPGAGAGMLAIFAAATVVGLAFNSLSPLGVRSEPAMAPAAAVTGKLYENETVAVSFGSGLPSAHPPSAASGGNYENETVGTRLEGSTARNGSPSPSPGDRTITWIETKKLLAAGSIVLVDARSEVFYQTGHIPGAISLPAVHGTPEAFATFAAKYPKETPLVVYCGSAQCPLAASLITILTESMGYKNVRHMPGGFVEYREAENQPSKGGAK